MSDGDEQFDETFDDAGLAELEQLEQAYSAGRFIPNAEASRKPNLQQRNLFGGIVSTNEAPKGKGKGARNGSANGSLGTLPQGRVTQAKVQRTKVWDPAAFAKHGWSKRTAREAKAVKAGRGKAKRKSNYLDEEAWDEDDEEVIEDDDLDDTLLDTTYDAYTELLPIKWEPDKEAIKYWQYPVQADKPLRSYQYSIVYQALLDNTLVSLPTGLGKTFIAACVMLNFYRWYPKGKIIFLAPTRPLVTQQIKACHYIAGIPQIHCVELTGQTMPKLRAIAWATKRVIYSTPQTVENDLRKGRLDPRDVTCLVVDEAHRATGDYAYSGVVRYMMSRNPHFRVLALTATPGAKGEAVQEVIDNLHIGHIEVRADSSIDIQQYIHKKSYDLTVIPLGSVLSGLRDRWASLMQPYIRPLLASKLIYTGDATQLNPYAVTLANQKLHGLPGGVKSNGRFFPIIKTLSAMCRAMDYLIIQSVSSFERALKDIDAMGPKALNTEPNFRALLQETIELKSKRGYVGHPKMERLRLMCIDHFKQAEGAKDDYGQKKETRVMVFCNFRAVVDEIVDCLNQQKPFIKATAFVGQGASKGAKGITQKDQIETIKKFKKGIYNVLVATSIGEEGLDIGEIDLIICYEANKSPIRMLQRVGRTGRARDGHIIVLMTEGREEKNWDKANDAYQEVQNALTSNKVFQLFVDGDRMLPKALKPEVQKVEIKALDLDIESMTMNGQSRVERKFLAESKPKFSRDSKLNVPKDAFMGFRKAGQLEVEQKRATSPPSPESQLRARKTAALLSMEEESELRERWQWTKEGKVESTIFDTFDLPFVCGESGSAHCIPRHSSKHTDLQTTLQLCERIRARDERTYNSWHDQMSACFDPQRIVLWDRESATVSSSPRVSLRRNVVKVEDSSSCPVEDLSTISTASMPKLSTPRPPSTNPSPQNYEIKVVSQKIAVPKLHANRLSPPDQPTSKVQSRKEPLPYHSPQDQDQHVRDVPYVDHPHHSTLERATLDPYNVLSSEEEDVVRAPIGKIKEVLALPIPMTIGNRLTPTKKSRDSGMAKQKHQQQNLMALTNSSKLAQDAVETVIMDSDGEQAIDTALLGEEEVNKSLTSQIRTTVRTEERSDPVVSRYFVERKLTSQEDETDSDEALQELLVPTTDKEEKSNPTTTCQRVPSSQEFEDEFSLFDISDENLLHDMLETTFAKVSKKRPLEEEDAVLMPPPVATGKARAEHEIHQPRQHQAKGVMRRLAVADSSSPVEPVRKVAAAAAWAITADGIPASTESQPLKAFKRIRRGGRSDVEHANRQASKEAKEGAVNRPQGEAVFLKKRRGKDRLGSKAALKSKLFDFEAANSSASGTEASTEEYTPENSDDRNFLASEDWVEGVDDSPGQAAFYRDSLLTQGPAAFAKPVVRGGAIRIGSPSSRVQRYTGTPGTPQSPDQWSYDSFCVPDDAEIEMESSSMQSTR